MAAKAYPLPAWLPDLANNVLTQAVNVYAIGNGYAPVPAPQAVTASLPAAFNGGGAYINSAGDSTLVAATSSNIYKYVSGAWTSILAASSGQTVRFAQFGDNLLLANGSAAKSYGLITGAVTTPTAAPDLIDIAQTRDFVMGITTDNALQWCQFNNSGVWTTGTNQADKQPSLWGQLRRIVGGEYVIALTDRAIVRGTYVGVEGGLDIIWQFDEISAEIGCVAGGSVCNVGRLIFFLSERGFEMCDGQTVTPIGDEKFNRWFFKRFSRTDIANISAAIDPRNSVAMWAMPGTPGLIIAYNWVLQRATVIQIDVKGIFTGYSAAIPLDALDAIYGNLDAIPVSLDDPSLNGGSPLLLVADATNALTALTGDSLEAVLQIDNLEPASGRRVRIRSARLVSDAAAATVTIDARMRSGDAEAIRTTATMRGNGKLPIRANGRYNTVKVTIPAATTWTHIQAVELEFSPGDGR